MEEDKLDKSMFREDFKDFEEEEVVSPEVEEEKDPNEMSIEELQAHIMKQMGETMPQEEAQNQELNEENKEVQEEVKAESNEAQKELTPDEIEELSQWEELDNENSVVKKYIFYVSKDFTPHLDNLTTDERSAFINDAIQRKLDAQHEEDKLDAKKRIRNHAIIMVLTIIFTMPLMLLFAHKAIMATFDNYKYSQESFEKLYKQRFEHDRAYMRSVQYNKEQQAKLKKKNK